MSTSEKARVLLVDDSESTNALIVAILRHDFEIEVATDGREALEKLKTGQWAAVLLDLRIPFVDGFALLDHLNRNDAELLRRTIVVTAAVSPRDLNRVKPYPVFGMIAKPFEIDALLNAVKTCCGRGGRGLGNLVSGGVVFLLADLLSRRWM